MGVPGLTNFVRSEEDSLLEPYKLCKTTVIIDGNNFTYKLFQGCSESREFFLGGDYDDIYSRVIEFFGVMLRCEIYPILLFDGCQPETKSETLGDRRNNKLDNLIELNRGRKSDEVLKSGTLRPVLLFEVLFEGLKEMGITCRRLYGEADPQIAALAEHLDCPVLSNDSDFFLYDVNLIPLFTMDLQCTEDEDGSLYFPCRLYRSGSLSKLFPPLQRQILPMVRIISDRSIVGEDVFTGYNTRNVRDIFKLLQTINNRESVITRILRGLDSEEVDSVESEIREILTSYDVSSSISLYAADIETGTGRDAKPLVDGLDLSGLPDKFLDSYKSCKVNPFMLSLVCFKRHYLPITIEDINEYSCHFPSIPIIREIYKILTTVTGAPEDVTLVVRMKGRLCNLRQVCSNEDYARAVPLTGNVLEEGEGFRREVFFQSLGLGGTGGELLTRFDDDWILFVTSAGFWYRSRELKPSHLRAALMMALCVYAHKGMGDRAGGGHRARRDPPPRPFANLLKRVPDTEVAKIRDRFVRVESSDRDIRTRADYFPTIHVFACLQSIQCHVMQLNCLLDEPFPGFRVSRFYSGTFFFNLSASSSEEEVTEGVPRMRDAYEFLERWVLSCGDRPAKK